MSLPEIVARGEGTVSDRIRALDAAGYSRAEIARILQKRYQHVRNVLEGDRAKTGSVGIARARSPTETLPGNDPSRTVVRIAIQDDGAVVLPPELAARLGLKPGGVAIGRMDDGAFTILSRAENLRQIREELRRFIPPDVSAVDALIAERRRENAEDERHG